MARQLSVRGAVVIFGVLFGLIWAGDGIYRLVNQPDEMAAIDDARFNNSEPETAEPITVTDDEGNTLVIQEAGSGFGGSEDLPDGYMTIPQDEAAIHTGMLVQLDSTHPYSGNPGEFVTFEKKNESYRMKRMDLPVRADVVSAMNSMASAYQSEIGAVNLMVYSTTAPYEKAGSLYPTPLPDQSTGYCVDLCLLNADETISRMETPNAWLSENAWKYGFVFSYTEADAGVSGVTAAPHHLRYIGRVHAGILQSQNLTLSGYYEYLKAHSMEVPLYYTVGETIYTVYYVPSEGGTTEVPIPKKAKYEISGNNTDGYIVTIEGKF